MITGKKIYMVGIKGVGMTSLALVYHRMGNMVSGSDVPKHFITDTVLEKYGITVYQEFSRAHVTPDIDFVVVSGAHANEQNVEFSSLLTSNIVRKSHAEALGELMDDFDLRISVCGSHGKTTTSAMLATIFIGSDKKGAHQIGVPTFSGSDGGAYNGSDYFIAEADEYANNPHIDNTPRFSFQHPHILLCTNIDFDHPDIYASIKAVQKAFGTFMSDTIGRGGKVVYCADDTFTSDVVKGLPYDHLYSYGFSKSADLVISDVQDDALITKFKATFRNEPLGEFVLHISGLHNILNAAGAILVSHLSHLSQDTIVKGLDQFTGSERRFQLISQKGSTYLFDDYAHHPREISAVIKAAKNKFPENRVIVIFQPHTYSRTNILADEFASSLREADASFVLEVFSSEREKSVSAILASLGKLYTMDKVCNELESEDLSNTTIITMGAGDIYTMHQKLTSIMEHLS